MSVCSATAAASSRPGCRRESRNSNTRASTSDAHFFNQPGHRMTDQRKYSTVSTSKSSSSPALCCIISILMAITLLFQFHTSLDFIG